MKLEQAIISIRKAGVADKLFSHLKHKVEKLIQYYKDEDGDSMNMESMLREDLSQYKDIFEKIKSDCPLEDVEDLIFNLSTAPREEVVVFIKENAPEDNPFLSAKTEKEIKEVIKSLKWNYTEEYSLIEDEVSFKVSKGDTFSSKVYFKSNIYSEQRLQDWLIEVYFMYKKQS